MGLNLQEIPFIRFPSISEEVKEVVTEVMENGVYFNGKYTKKFIHNFSNYLNLKYCIPTANCTDALEIILRARNIGHGDEVIVPAFTWFSDASVIKILGAEIVFVDVDLGHFGIDYSSLASEVTVSTKAIILPHLFGITHPQIHLIKKLCAENDILLIEDCAQAHGSRLEGQLAGTFGDVTAFSFYPTKNLGALGDAGAIVTNDTELAQKCLLWANHGQKNRNIHEQLGKNSRMDELQAAVLCAKLPFLEADNKKRREFAGVYFKELKGLPLILPMDCEGHVYHQFVIMVEERDDLKSFLHENNIETDIHYPQALVSIPVFDVDNQNFENALRVAKTALSLPIHPNHSPKDILLVCDQINKYFKK